MDTLIRPGDNFDAYVNGTWQRNTLIPADKPSYAIWSMTNLRKMLKPLSKTPLKVILADGSDEQKIGDFMDRTWIL
jgi:putative endopeptidase